MTLQGIVESGDAGSSSRIVHFISRLRECGVDVWTEGGQLRYGGTTSRLNSEDLDLLRTGEEEILSVLTSMAIEQRAVPAISTVTRDEPLVLSFAQRRLHFLANVEGASQAYHIPLYLRLRGCLNEAALRCALNALVARHEILRTRFQTHNEHLRQWVLPAETGFRLVYQNLQSEVDAEDRLAVSMLDEISEAFDLEQGPLVRGRLIRIAPDNHALLITFHHIITDGWSIGILARELSCLYNSDIDGKPHQLTPHEIQYADYAAWQRQCISAHRLPRQASYWRNTLAGAPAILSLPTDRPRPSTQEFSGELEPFELDPTLTQRLRSLAQCQDVTLFTVLLAGWAVLLSRLSGQDDLVIGVPTANRTTRTIENLIGLFVNTLALRIDLSGDPSLETVLSRTKAVLLAAQANQELPFEQVVEIARPIRSPAHTPVFQVMFAWQSHDAGAFELSGLEVTAMRAPMRTAKYDMTLDLSECEGCIVGTLNYSTSLFETDTARRHLSYFRHMLLAMAADVHQQIASVNLLSDDERHCVLVEWNHTSVEYAEETLIHELFEEQVLRTPEAPAVRFQGRTLTYSELNVRANQLARYLRREGVVPDELVAVCLERGFDLVVALLGVLKAGGAYVPLDPICPQERLAYMLKDASPRVLLTQEELRKSVLPPLATLPVAMDSLWSELRSQEPSNLHTRSAGCKLTSRNLAYVMYTSGSTGEPKGVAAEHRATVNRIRAQLRISAFSDDDICCQKTSIGFVDSVFEILGPLCYGRPLVIAPQSASADLQRLSELIAHERVTRLISVPSLARAILESARAQQSVKCLRHWTLSGEELTGELLGKLQRQLPECSFTNLYGSSEVAADVTYYSCENFAGEHVSIGRPIANTRVYILDTRHQPMPIGVPGEIYVGGVAVARGYLNRPELTSERFLPDPFSSTSHARMYKTGDLGRWQANGEIEFLGRRDHQVKIRGFRIEIGEIEARLTEYPVVKEAAVVARQDVLGEKRLVAYLVPREPTTLDVEKLSAHLMSVLPEYMVPTAFVMLDRLPVTQNGKLDRSTLALPDPDAYIREEYASPQGQVERTLADLWMEMLNVERVGRNDNFFALGGHSLLLTTLVGRIWDHFAIQCPIQTVFQNPTLRRLATAIDQLLLAGQQTSPSRQAEIEEGAV